MLQQPDSFGQRTNMRLSTFEFTGGALPKHHQSLMIEKTQLGKLRRVGERYSA